MQPKLEGRFSDGRDSVSWTGDSISMGETLFRCRVSGGKISYQSRGDSVSGETLFRDTGVLLYCGMRNLSKLRHFIVLTFALHSINLFRLIINVNIALLVFHNMGRFRNNSELCLALSSL